MGTRYDDIVLLVSPKETHRQPKNKGKCAASTESRRLVWEHLVWPLVLDLKRPYFTLEEYHSKRNQICELYGIPHSGLSGGFTSLATRGLLTRENGCYSLHYRLIPYMRKRIVLEYGTAVKEGYSKT
jgi:hypothetical protein